MQNITPTDAIDLLEQQDRVLTKKIAELNGFQDMLHVKVQSILQGINSGEFEPKVIRQAAMPLFLSDPIDKKKADLSDEEWLGLYGKCKTHGIALGYPEGFMVSKSALLSGTTDQVSRIICHVGDFSYGNSAMPGGTYLVACGNGSFEDTEPIYKRMFQYIEENSFQIIGNAYEARLIDETGSKDREKQIIQVKIRISTKK